jgi:hypothetical protein
MAEAVSRGIRVAANLREHGALIVNPLRGGARAPHALGDGDDDRLYLALQSPAAAQRLLFAHKPAAASSTSMGIADPGILRGEPQCVIVAREPWGLLLVRKDANGLVGTQAQVSNSVQAGCCTGSRRDLAEARRPGAPLAIKSFDLSNQKRRGPNGVSALVLQVEHHSVEIGQAEAIAVKQSPDRVISSVVNGCHYELALCIVPIIVLV